MSRMPQVTARELVRFLKGHGFLEDRQSGSHLTLWQPERNVSVTVPVHTGCDIGRGPHSEGRWVQRRRVPPVALIQCVSYTPRCILRA
jgi:predicted RNA binding protein YcfA (HicA-like mRNA interferase family)